MFSDLPPLHLIAIAFPFTVLYVTDVLGIFILPLALADYYRGCNSIGYGAVAAIKHTDVTMCNVSVNMTSWATNVTVPCYTIEGATLGQPAKLHYNMRDPEVCTRLLSDEAVHATYEASVFVIRTVLSAWTLSLCLVLGFLYYERRRSRIAAMRDFDA